MTTSIQAPLGTSSHSPRRPHPNRGAEHELKPKLGHLGNLFCISNFFLPIPSIDTVHNAASNLPLTSHPGPSPNSRTQTHTPPPDPKVPILNDQIPLLQTSKYVTMAFPHKTTDRESDHVRPRPPTSYSCSRHA